MHRAYSSAVERVHGMDEVGVRLPVGPLMENIGFAYAIGAAVLWGLVYAIDQKILMEVSPLALLFATSVLTSVFLLPFIFFDQGSMRELFHSGKLNLSLIFGSVALMAVANFCIYSGIKALDASTASVIEIAYPFFVVLFSFFLYRAVPNVFFLLGGALIFVGSYIIIRFGS